jgi:hypoxanthine phosphoribosyltransferase
MADVEWPKVRKLSYDTEVYPGSLIQAAEIWTWRPHVIMYLPRGGATYAHLLSEHLKKSFKQYNRVLIKLLITAFPNIRILLVDDSIGGGSTLADVVKEIPPGENFRFSVIWIDRDYPDKHKIHYYMMLTNEGEWLKAPWETESEKEPGKRTSRGVNSIHENDNPVIENFIQDYLLDQKRHRRWRLGSLLSSLFTIFH